MQAFPCETYRHIYQFLDRPSQAAMRLTCFSNFRHGKCPPSSRGHAHLDSFESLCADVLTFKRTGRLNVSTGYAGIECMSVCIGSRGDNWDWDQFNEAMEWIKPKILTVEGFLFNSSSCWERLGNLLTHGCQFLRLKSDVPTTFTIVGRRTIPIEFLDSGPPGDTISPYSLATITPQQILVLQKAPDVHHISIDLPEGLLLPVHGPYLQDDEMSFINRLHMSNLTSIYLVRQDGEDPFRGWACYWAKEEGTWMKIADGEDAFAIDMLTSELEEEQCESRRLTYGMLSHFCSK
jgi:hypothetical protein